MQRWLALSWHGRIVHETWALYNYCWKLFLRRTSNDHTSYLTLKNRFLQGGIFELDGWYRVSLSTHTHERSVSRHSLRSWPCIFRVVSWPCTSKKILYSAWETLFANPHQVNPLLNQTWLVCLQAMFEWTFSPTLCDNDNLMAYPLLKF